MPPETPRSGGVTETFLALDRERAAAESLVTYAITGPGWPFRRKMPEKQHRAAESRPPWVWPAPSLFLLARPYPDRLVLLRWRPRDTARVTRDR